MSPWITSRSDVLKILGAWLACLTVLCGIWLASILYFHGSARRANAIRLAGQRLRVHELEARRAEKDFMLRSLTDPEFFRQGRSRHLQKHRAQITAIRGEIENIATRVSPEQNGRVQQLLDAVGEYDHHFEELVSSYRERGFQEWGLMATLETTRARLLGDLRSRKNPGAYLAALSISSAEQAFLLSRSRENADRVEAVFASSRDVLLKEDSEPTREDTLRSFEEHHSAFSRLRELEARIGFGEELGLQGELRKAIHAVEPIVEEILEDAVAADDEATRTLMVGLIGACLIMAVLLALAIFFGQTARLHNRKLIQVNRQMEEEHRKLLQAERLAAIGQVVAGLAHESRNAFQRTHACLDMLSEKVRDRPEALDLVGRIEESQDYIHLLYEQVREYAAPLRVKAALVRLSDVVQSAWERQDLTRERRKIRFEQHVDGTDLSCEVDAFAIEQVFRNIFENSLAACDDPVILDVRYRERRLAGRSAVEVSVADNGPGLDAEQRARIFEPFYTTKTKGTGLGMAIAKRLVEAHGGGIEVGSATQGAEILVTLPRKPREAP